MKRTLIIITGLALVLILISILVYVILFKPTTTKDTYSDLDFEDTNNYSITQNLEEETQSEPIIDVSNFEKIRQLTTKPVVGYQEVNLNEGDDVEVYYIESGTGHVYSINLTTGEEKRVSATTIPSSRKGVITSNGLYTLIQSGLGNGSQFAVGVLSTTSDKLSVNYIDENITSFTTSKENTFLYTAKVNNNLVGKEYFPSNNSSETLFTIPFTEAKIDWGTDATDTHHVYPKSDSRLEGYLYEITNGSLKRLAVSGLGLSAIGNNDHVLYSKQQEGDYVSYIHNKNTLTESESFISVITDKCINVLVNFICATTIEDLGTSIPENWYQGNVSYSDKLWEIDPVEDSVVYLVDVTAETGRDLDIINLRTNKSNSSIYFQNKSDQNLWMYELPEKEIISETVMLDEKSESNDTI